MEITGILKLKYDVQKVSDKFQKREFVITTDFDSQYPQQVQFQLVQDKCGLLDPMQVGDMVTIDFNLRGREWNGPQGTKYFNTLDAWRIQLVNGTMIAQPIQSVPQPVNVAPQNVVKETSAPTFNAAINDDDLPF